MTRTSRQTFTEPAVPGSLLRKVNQCAAPFQSVEDFEPILQRCSNSKATLLGEASHGTSEFYSFRAEISKKLIEEAGYKFIAVEGDWPPCYRVNQYIKGYDTQSENAKEVLSTFTRWPTWMWNNHETADLVEWLRDYNRALPAEDRVGFYGLDVYSLWESLGELEGIITQHGAEYPTVSKTMQRTIECFEALGTNVRTYAKAVMAGYSCEESVTRLVRALRERAPRTVQLDADLALQMDQNAQVLRNAETYYRTMMDSDAGSWNVRDHHMFETLARLLDFYGSTSRAVVWEHNTHVGDARFTDMKDSGMINIGQLARKAFGEDNTTIVGFSSYQGSVIAGNAWGAPMQEMVVPPGREGSWERVLHNATHGQSSLINLSEQRSDREMGQPRGHRAIGVVYHPEYERFGNYVPTDMTKRYDAVVYLDTTHALRPIAPSRRTLKAVPATYPSAM